MGVLGEKLIRENNIINIYNYSSFWWILVSHPVLPGFFCYLLNHHIVNISVDRICII